MYTFSHDGVTFTVQPAEHGGRGDERRLHALNIRNPS